MVNDLFEESHDVCAEASFGNLETCSFIPHPPQCHPLPLVPNCPAKEQLSCDGQAVLRNPLDPGALFLFLIYSFSASFVLLYFYPS